jgi:hypothetical protein
MKARLTEQCQCVVLPESMGRVELLEGFEPPVRAVGGRLVIDKPFPVDLDGR